MKFKVGDRVKYVGPYMHNKIGVVLPLEDVQEGHLGEVVDVIPLEVWACPYRVQFEGLLLKWPMAQHELELAQ